VLFLRSAFLHAAQHSNHHALHTMDGNLYDEFGNYVGPEIDDEEEEDAFVPPPQEDEDMADEEAAVDQVMQEEGKHTCCSIANTAYNNIVMFKFPCVGNQRKINSKLFCCSLNNARSLSQSQRTLSYKS
jgi:hypothetical protein